MNAINFKIPFLIEQDDPKMNKKDELAHCHNSFEIIKILEGQYICHVSGQNFIANKGDICIINRARIHRILNKNNKSCSKKVFIFDPDYFIDNQKVYQKFIVPLQDDDSFSHLKINSSIGIGLEIDHLIDEIEILNKEKQSAYELETIGYIYMIVRRLFLVYTSYQKIIKEKYDPNLSIQRKMTYFIYQHYTDKISLDDIAHAGLVSKSTCIRLFKKYAGKSPITYLNKYRLEISTQLLMNTENNIVEIALQCGFLQASYFNHLFKKEYNMSPNKYRHLYMRKN